jgi:hypothetical protein
MRAVMNGIEGKQSQSDERALGSLKQTTKKTVVVVKINKMSTAQQKIWRACYAIAWDRTPEIVMTS